jgi:hypothetical protein
MRQYREKLELKYAKVIPLQPKTNWSQYGWAAAIVLLVGIGFQYNQLDQTTNQVVRPWKAKIEKI